MAINWQELEPKQEKRYLRTIQRLKQLPVEELEEELQKAKNNDDAERQELIEKVQGFHELQKERAEQRGVQRESENSTPPGSTRSHQEGGRYDISPEKQRRRERYGHPDA